MRPRLLHSSTGKRATGFTIIEVMIVLAVAAVILLIVFLAVPALQRNSRNTQYRSEASRLLGAANEFVTSTNNGNPPAASSCSGAGSNSNTKCGYTGTPLNSAQQIWQTANSPGNIVKFDIIAGPTGANTVSVTPDTDHAYLYTAASCGSAAGANYNVGSGSIKTMVLVFVVEGSGGSKIAQCQAS